MLTAVETVLERLERLYPRLIDLSLDRLVLLLDRLGNPERRLPPVIHVAGTNGKGSTCAYLRAIAEASGLAAHVYTSPHLVRFNERIRLAGKLVDDETLAGTLEDVERVNDGAPITVFEVLVAVAFVLFARVPADVAIVEVGLGGRADATNVVASPAACAITSISMDHQDFLGDTLAAIAGEKAGIIKPGVPVVTGSQQAGVLPVLAAKAAAEGARLLARGRDWQVRWSSDRLRFEDGAGRLDLPRPSLLGGHQLDNAGVAIAAVRASGLGVAERGFSGIARAEWPGRLQRLRGRLAALLPETTELWLDGGHNQGAGAALAQQLLDWNDRPVHLIVGMKQAKDPAAFLKPLLPHADTIWAVREPAQYMALPVETIIEASGGRARPGPTVAEALASLPDDGRPARVLICGSLYLAGEVLKADQG